MGGRAGRHRASLRWAFERLLTRFGPQGWWPAETPFEVCVGAILVQGTSWRNAELALDALRRADRLCFERMRGLGSGPLARLIRPVGFHRAKARRLGAFVEFLEAQYDGDADALGGTTTADLREKLLAVNGIGPETADAIALYAAGKPIFVVDAYARRVFSRLGLIEQDAPHEELREWVASQLGEDTDVYNEYHALIVALGKTICRKQPRCGGCPLRDRCPRGGLEAAGEK